MRHAHAHPPTTTPIRLAPYAHAHYLSNKSNHVRALPLDRTARSAAENASHHNELPPILNTFIRPALVRRGVAGDDSWGSRPHDEFRIPAGELQFKFAFQGIK